MFQGKAEECEEEEKGKSLCVQSGHGNQQAGDLGPELTVLPRHSLR